MASDEPGAVQLARPPIEQDAPAGNPAHAGYPRITPEIWKAFDEAMAHIRPPVALGWHRQAARPAEPPTPNTSGRSSASGPTLVRSAEGRFGYRN